MRESSQRANVHCRETKDLFDRKWHQGSKDEELSHSIKLSAENFLCHAMLWMSSPWKWIVCGCAGLCVCVCVCTLKPLNNCCEGGETHQRPSYSVFPLSWRCRFTPPSPSAVESSKWQQRIDLLIHERDGLLRAPGDNRVEDHSAHHGERLWSTCVAFTLLYLISYIFFLNGFVNILAP